MFYYSGHLCKPAIWWNHWRLCLLLFSDFNGDLRLFSLSKLYFSCLKNNLKEALALAKQNKLKHKSDLFWFCCSPLDKYFNIAYSTCYIFIKILLFQRDCEINLLPLKQRNSKVTPTITLCIFVLQALFILQVIFWGCLTCAEQR